MNSQDTSNEGAAEIEPAYIESEGSGDEYEDQEGDEGDDDDSEEMELDEEEEEQVSRRGRHGGKTGAMKARQAVAQARQQIEDDRNQSTSRVRLSDAKRRPRSNSITEMSIPA